MTEKTFNRLAAEARERHKSNLDFFSNKNQFQNSSDAFWHWWGSWMKKESSYPPQNYLIYSGGVKKVGGVYRQIR